MDSKSRRSAQNDSSVRGAVPCSPIVPHTRSQTSADSSPGLSSRMTFARASSGVSSVVIEAAPRTISVIGQKVIPSP